MTAYGYIRQSRRADLEVALSYDVQLAAIRRLAERDGLNPDTVVILSDMGRSGARGKERLRPSYGELVRHVESGDATHVFALSMSRLARSIVELHKFFDKAKDHGVRIVFDKESYDLSTATGRLNANIIASVYEFERDMAVERVRDNIADNRAKGKIMGRRPYGEKPGESPADVVAAFRQAGSYNGAAVLLNEAGKRSHLGRDWSGTSVRLVVAREDPKAAPRNARRGARSGSGFLLAGLLRDEQGHTLTAATSHGGKYVRYHCHRASADRSHPRPVSVSAPFVEAYVHQLVDALEDRLHRRIDRVELAATAEADREAIAGERDRLVILFAKKKIDEATFDRLAKPLDEQLERLEDATVVVDLPRIDWSWPAAEVNRLLRRLIDHVVLGADLRPVRVEWRLDVG